MQNRRLVRSRACELLPSNDGVHQRECRPKPANALGSDLHRRDVTSEKALPKPVIRGTKVRPASNAPTNALKDSRAGRSACQATHPGRGFELATGSAQRRLRSITQGFGVSSQRKERCAVNLGFMERAARGTDRSNKVRGVWGKMVAGEATVRHCFN